MTSLLSVFIEKSLINPNSVLLFKMFVSNDSGFKINNVCKNLVFNITTIFVNFFCTSTLLIMPKVSRLRTLLANSGSNTL